MQKSIVGFVSDEECEKLTNNFFSSPYMYNRQGSFLDSNWSRTREFNEVYTLCFKWSIKDVGGGVHQYVGPYISGNVNFDTYMKGRVPRTQNFEHRH